MSEQERITYEPVDGTALIVAAQLRHEMSLEVGHDYDVLRPGWRERFVAYFSEKQLANKAQVFMARSGDVPIGILAASMLENYRTQIFDQRTGNVNAVFVRPPWRRRGVAGELMRFGLDWLRERGCEIVRLHTSQAARPMYEHLGFAPSEEMILHLTPVEEILKPR
ncbi:MAG TPA: GNAT family N-acetyltransferase [Candidatus Baltobacteraceae bacterium]|jgi:GNAT superfamily N-acetyltransferase|nr:GNAT family N-acetyltransferase [Candidatus Baltobacteraceae bacterium]